MLNIEQVHTQGGGFGVNTPLESDMLQTLYYMRK